MYTLIVAYSIHCRYYLESGTSLCLCKLCDLLHGYCLLSLVLNSMFIALRLRMQGERIQQRVHLSDSLDSVVNLMSANKAACCCKWPLCSPTTLVVQAEQSVSCVCAPVCPNNNF